MFVGIEKMELALHDFPRLFWFYELFRLRFNRENTLRELIPAFRKCDQKFYSSFNEDSLSLIL